MLNMQLEARVEVHERPFSLAFIDNLAYTPQQSPGAATKLGQNTP
jgi:hypothetical protein